LPFDLFEKGQANGKRYRRGADLADKTHSVEPDFGAESTAGRGESQPLSACTQRWAALIFN
jgi:hypothetical protein